MAGSSKVRGALSNVLRISITVFALGYVLTQITWKDRLLPREGDGDKPISGWLVKGPDGSPQLRDDAGVLHPVADAGERLVPGFITLLRGIKAGYLALGIVLFPITILVMARRWQRLLMTHGLDPGYWETVRLSWIGMLANHVFPSSVGGDFVKGWCIFRRTPGKRVPAIMTVLMDRILGLISLMLVGATAILTQLKRPEIAAQLGITLWVLFAILLGGMVFYSGRMRRLLRVSDILARLPFSKQLQQVDESMFHYRGHVSVLARCVGMSLVVHACVIFCTYLLGRSLSLPIAMINYFIFLPIIFIAGAFVPSIAGLGVMEVMFQKTFALPGIGADPSSAVALCILYRLMTLVGSLPGAIPTYQEFSAHGVPTLGENREPPEPRDPRPLQKKVELKAAC